MSSSLMHASRPEPPGLDVAAQADLAACQALMRQGSASFYATARLFPRWLRERATAFYAFCRLGDDAADEPGASLLSLARLERRLSAIYAGRPASHAVDRAFARLVERSELPRALVEALLEGFRWDLEGRTYETLSDVYAYAARVAGSVGVVMALLMERHGRATLARAAELGVAMQLTNIARDVGEDVRRARIYLPRQWLEEAGLHPQQLLGTPRFSPELGRVVQRLLGTAEALYGSAERGIPALPPGGRVAVMAARRIYADIGRVIARNGFDSMSQRARTSAARKLWLLTRSLPAAFNGGSAPDAPPLAETRFLIDAAASPCAFGDASFPDPQSSRGAPVLQEGA
jgi:phytoene synthase